MQIEIISLFPPIYDIFYFLFLPDFSNYDF